MSPPMAPEAITVISGISFNIAFSSEVDPVRVKKTRQNKESLTRRRFAQRLRTHIAWVTGSNCGGFLMAVFSTGWQVKISALVLVLACSVPAAAQERLVYSPPDL